MAETFLLRRDWSAEEWTIFQSPFGGLGPFSSPLLPPALLVFLRRSPRAPSLPASFLDRHWLIEREGCSLLIGCDSSVLPEVGVPPHAVSFHSEITALSRRRRKKIKSAGRDYPGSVPEEADEFLRTEGKREAHFGCHATSVTGAVPVFIEMKNKDLFLFIYFTLS